MNSASADGSSSWLAYSFTKPAPSKTECEDAAWSCSSAYGCALVVADGLGSAASAAYGAGLAVRISFPVLSSLIASPVEGEDLQSRTTAAFHAVAEAWERELAFHKLDSGAAATTLSWLIIMPPWVVLISVGDSFGAILLETGETVLVLYTARVAGKSSEVQPLTQVAAGKVNADLIWEPGITGAFLSTDGLEDLVVIERLPETDEVTPARRVPRTDQVIGGMLSALLSTHDTEVVRFNAVRHQDLKGDDIGVAAAIRL